MRLTLRWQSSISACTPNKAWKLGNVCFGNLNYQVEINDTIIRHFYGWTRHPLTLRTPMLGLETQWTRLFTYNSFSLRFPSIYGYTSDRFLAESYMIFGFYLAAIQLKLLYRYCFVDYNFGNCCLPIQVRLLSCVMNLKHPAFHFSLEF